MAQRSSAGVSDAAGMSITPPVTNNKVYGAILSATNETAGEVLKTALKMRELTNKPVMLVIGEGE